MTLDTTARLKLADDIVMQFGNKLYSQETWWVVIREIIQNALDAGAKNIYVKSDNKSWLEIQDDGIGMSKEDLLNTFLTVGGSNKRERNESTVGGFGIAKLAIFACDDFEVISRCYRLTKDILINHKELENLSLEDSVPHGVKVKIIKKDLLGYFSKKDIATFLSFINRDNVRIIFNGDRIEKFPTAYLSINKYKERIQCTEQKFGGDYCYILVRANGLPVFKSILYSVKVPMVLIYDVTTTLDPYDEQYPFTMTRDYFNGESEDGKKYSAFCTAVIEHYNQLDKIEKAEREKIAYDEKTGYYSQYNGDINPETISLMKKYKDFIQLMYNLNLTLLGSQEKFAVGIIGQNPNKNKKTMGSYFYDSLRSQPVYLISQDMSEKPEILGIAIHEFTHRNHSDHYEDFADAMTTTIIKVLDAMSTLNL